MNKLTLLAVLLTATTSQAANTGLTASSLKIKVYKFAVSTSPLCTNLTTVVDNGSTPSEVEFVGGAGLGSGTIAAGTYPCIVIEMDNIITFTPSANSDIGSCSTSTASTLNVCSNGTSTLIDGTTSTCAATATRVALHLSTASSGTSDPWKAPTSLSDATYGFNLGTALTVSGSASGKFVVNPSGKVCDYSASGCDGQSSTSGSPSSCHLEPPTFSFTSGN